MSCLATSMNSKCGCVYYTLKYHQSHDVCDGSDVEKSTFTLRQYSGKNNATKNNLSHPIENTANQTAGKADSIQRYCIY